MESIPEKGDFELTYLLLKSCKKGMRGSIENAFFEI